MWFHPGPLGVSEYQAVHARLQSQADRQGNLDRQQTLALQLLFLNLLSFQMRASGGSLVSASPERPGDDVGWLDAPLRKTCSNAADLLNRPADERLFRLRVRRIGVCEAAG